MDTPQVAGVQDAERRIIIAALARTLADELDKKDLWTGQEVVNRAQRILDHAKALT